MDHKNTHNTNIITKPRKRDAGILLHISSLPGDFGIGDFGPGAKQFIGFLERAKQRYWQVLPLNITNKLNNFSPYSSHSAFAGNTLFIDPFQLVEMGFVSKAGQKKLMVKTGNRVDFRVAAERKSRIIREAFINFRLLGPGNIRNEYRDFIKKEQFWLDDFALYECLYNHFSEQPWNKWPVGFRDRNPDKLTEFSLQHEKELELVRFAQFLFSRQWTEVKAYANKRGIKIFGDIPVYIDYNSADVWSNPEYFHLDQDGSMISVAGVPPDYFNKDGQHWGMPIFNWHAIKKEGYYWWLRRIEKNLTWFDLLRLDHLRGFSAYWEIPADAVAAI